MYGQFVQTPCLTIRYGGGMPRSQAATGRRVRSAPATNGDIKKAVCDATERLLAGRRFTELSVADILGEAGVSRASFYFYFASKYELLSAVSERAIDDVYDVAQSWLEREHDEPPIDALRDAMRGALQQWRTHGPVLRAVAEASVTAPEIDAQWRRLVGRFTTAASAQIERERAAGVAPEGLDAHTLATMLTWMTERALYLTVSGERPQFTSDERLADTLAGVWWRAIYGAGPAGAGASSGLLQSR